jgi:hypothetical protein
VYSLLLQRDGNVDAHGVEVGGILAVSLGHGIKKSLKELLQSTPYRSVHIPIHIYSSLTISYYPPPAIHISLSSSRHRLIVSSKLKELYSFKIV